MVTKILLENLSEDSYVQNFSLARFCKISPEPNFVKSITMFHIQYFLGLLFIVSTTVSGQFTDRFQPHGDFDNYVIWQETDGDDGSLQARYSFKYNFFDCEIGNEKDQESFTICKDTASAKFYGYFSFTGEFDFYLGTRPSGPVINRTSNPAFHGLWEFSDSSKFFNWIDVGIEHRSNGQVVDANEKDDTPGSPTFGQFLTEIEFQNNNLEYFDAISRSANFLSVAIGKHQSEQFGWSTSYKFYFNDESEITWGDLADKDVSIKDFDILRFEFFDTYSLGSNDSSFPEITLAVEYTIGEELDKTDSVDLNIIFPYRTKYGWKIPWTLRIHSGPMDRLSNYTESIDSIGLGINFLY